MPDWHDIHKGMQVYSADEHNLGHVAEVYTDSFLLHKCSFFRSNCYLPYSTVACIDGAQILLTISANEAYDKKWMIRPNYEQHLGDPTQLLYDRGHGVHDPFDEASSHTL